MTPTEYQEPVVVGATLTDATGNRSAKLGIRFIDQQSGKLLGMTGAAFLEGIPDGKVYVRDASGSKTLAGFAIAGFPRQLNGLTSISSRIGLFEIKEELVGTFLQSLPAKPEQALGRVVFSAGNVAGEVTAVGSVVSLEGAGEFADVIEVESTKEEPFARPGDGGSLVTLENGSALGIVVGGSQTTTFVAPLSDVLARTDFALQPTLPGTAVSSVDVTPANEWPSVSVLARLVADLPLLPSRDTFPHPTQWDAVGAKYPFVSFRRMRPGKDPFSDPERRAYALWAEIRSEVRSSRTVFRVDGATTVPKVYAFGLSDAFRASSIEPGMVIDRFYQHLSRSSGQERDRWREALATVKAMLAMKPIEFQRVKEALSFIAAPQGKGQPLLDDRGQASLDGVRLDPSVYVLATEGVRVALETLQEAKRLHDVKVEFSRQAGTELGDVSFSRLLKEMAYGKSVTFSTAAAIDISLRVGGRSGEVLIKVASASHGDSARPAQTERFFLKAEAGW